MNVEKQYRTQQIYDLIYTAQSSLHLAIATKGQLTLILVLDGPCNKISLTQLRKEKEGILLLASRKSETQNWEDARSRSLSLNYLCRGMQNLNYADLVIKTFREGAGFRIPRNNPLSVQMVALDNVEFYKNPKLAYSYGNGSPTHLSPGVVLFSQQTSNHGGGGLTIIHFLRRTVSIHVSSSGGSRQHRPIGTPVEPCLLTKDLDDR